MYSGSASHPAPEPNAGRSPTGLRPHAYDPAAQPELFEGVLARRMAAFFIDLIVIAVPLIAAGTFIFFLGLVTFGLGWALYWLLSPASVIWALFYYGLTLEIGRAHV